MEGLLLAAKAALEFIQSIDGYENSVTAVNLRREIEAVEHSVQRTGLTPEQIIGIEEIVSRSLLVHQLRQPRR